MREGGKNQTHSGKCETVNSSQFPQFSRKKNKHIHVISHTHTDTHSYTPNVAVSILLCWSISDSAGGRFCAIILQVIAKTNSLLLL